MNGMQRFLSRREKHQAEKRKSKEAARNKVRSYNKVSTVDSSDHMPLQRKSGQPVSTDLYKIFTNEDSKPTADKDASKNVRAEMRNELVCR
jgi:hypothetical protein